MMKSYGMQHIGLTVPDLDEAEVFFTAIFGAVTCFSTGLVDVDDAHMIRRLGFQCLTTNFGYPKPSLRGCGRFCRTSRAACLGWMTGG
jgi:catechol 2,3-dioxygenase-like lactoylglutathione lyase family enzyme